MPNIYIFYIVFFTGWSVCSIFAKEPEVPIGLLYPIDSETREVKSLDGIWRFIKSDKSNPMQGFEELWFNQDLEKTKNTIPMPVPSSYNDITTDKDYRDNVGPVWYQKNFFIPQSWSIGRRVWLRFSSVHYSAIVWLNSKEIIKHSIGHLPFEVEITHKVLFGAKNRVTVLCDNTLLNTTIPQGYVSEEENDSGSVLIQSYTFDFFNYAGIHRSVFLYTTPKVFIKDINIKTKIEDTTGVIYYNVTIDDGGGSAWNANNRNFLLHIQATNKEGEPVDTGNWERLSFKGSLKIPNAQLWWPYLMDEVPGYLYELEFHLLSADSKLLDVYRLHVGIRTISWTNTTFLINGKKAYLRGLGRHEDSDIRGKGFDWPLLARDFNLLKWLGANTYRTSHYPYSEESMQFADAHGIMIIDECPSVNTDLFSSILLSNHKDALGQLIHRDRNHPSVIMWSIANEPRSENERAFEYFHFLTSYARRLDCTRPFTGSMNTNLKNDKMAPSLDIISFNRYNAWYHNSGRLDMIRSNVVKEAENWHKEFNKTVLMSEYGADSVEGLHFLPEFIWSEDFQISLMSKHFEAFDILRSQSWFIGEFVWNFADFKTAQTFTRVGGNKKGVFTRNRQPKAAAYHLRQRYYTLCQQLDRCTVPDDVFNYIAAIYSDQMRTEL